MLVLGLPHCNRWESIAAERTGTVDGYKHKYVVTFPSAAGKPLLEAFAKRAAALGLTTSDGGLSVSDATTGNSATVSLTDVEIVVHGKTKIREKALELAAAFKLVSAELIVALGEKASIQNLHLEHSGNDVLSATWELEMQSGVDTVTEAFAKKHGLKKHASAWSRYINPNAPDQPELVLTLPSARPPITLDETYSRRADGPACASGLGMTEKEQEKMFNQMMGDD